MSKKAIIILGGGISGLTLAYELAKHREDFHIRLIEKSNHLGGWVDTDSSTGFFFEKGPRVFRGSRSPHFLSLTQEIGLHPEMVESSKNGQTRYLWMDGKLHRIPILSWGLVQGVFKDLKTPPLKEDDESVWDFACRRFNTTVAEHFFDPLGVGIYGGDIKTLSAKSCFPLYKSLENQHGSLIKGLIKRPRFHGPFMFGFQRGMKSVVQRLQEKTPIPFHLDEEVVAVIPKGEGFEVKTSQTTYYADYLFSALPAHIIGKLLIPELCQLSMQGTTIVNLGYRKNVLKKKGFGYLVSSKEDDEVRGVVFNSNTFPQYNRFSEETRLTVKLRSATLSDGESRSLSLKALSKHLGITAQPDVSMVIHAPNVFPQFRVGHGAWMQNLEQELQHRYPTLKLVGNYLYGVGVNDCIARSQSVAENFIKSVLYQSV